MKLIVGLGNPGDEYNNTRHNIGFMCLDYIVGKENFKLNKRFNALECKKNVSSDKVLFIKPLSFMNLSGEVVSKYVNYYKIDLEDILIIHDDLDMPIGTYKFQYNHGDGGHNGIKNIISCINTKKFLRFKIGISKSSEMDTKDYVLGKFSFEELDEINNVIKCVKHIDYDFVNLNIDRLIGKYNSKVLSD